MEQCERKAKTDKFSSTSYENGTSEFRMQRYSFSPSTLKSNKHIMGGFTCFPFLSDLIGPSFAKGSIVTSYSGWLMYSAKYYEQICLKTRDKQVRYPQDVKTPAEFEAKLFSNTLFKNYSH